VLGHDRKFRGGVEPVLFGRSCGQPVAFHIIQGRDVSVPDVATPCVFSAPKDAR